MPQRHSPRPDRPSPRPGAALAALAALLMLAMAAATAWAGQGFADLAWLTEEYYPYSFDDGGRVRGISADLLRLVWKELDEPEHPIRLRPWARAYRAATETPGTVLFSMARTAEREDLFKWAGPIAVVRFVLSAPRGRHTDVDSMDDLQGLTVGTLRDDVGDRLLAPWRGVCRVEPVARMDQNLEKLKAGRIQMVAYEERSLRLLLARHGLDPHAFETVLVLSEAPVYFAFHRATDDALVRRFQNALEDAKNSQAYADLLETYRE